MAVDVPIIGLWKVGSEGVFITPTLEHALTVAERGADIVAVDGTRRPRPDGRTLAEVTAALHERTDALVMADCGSAEDALFAEAAGVDVLGTTLAGYTGERPRGPGPDLDLLAAMVAATNALPVLCEGRVSTPDQARAAIEAGAHAVVVGTAITHPTTLTARFIEALPDHRDH